MKQRIIFLTLLACIAGGQLFSQVLYTRLPFGQCCDSYQEVYRTYQSADGQIHGPYPRTYSVRGGGTSTISAFTGFGARREKLVLIIGQKDFLDLTNAVEISGTGVSTPRILEKGVDNRGKSNQMTWVKLEMYIDGNSVPGNRTIRLKRPSFTGGDVSTVTLNLRNNYRLLYRSPLTISGTPVSGVQAYASNAEVRFTFEGHRLQLIKGIKNTGNNLQGSIIRNLRLIERGPSKLVFSCNFVAEGSLTMAEFINRYLDVEPGAFLFELNCRPDCLFVRTFVNKTATSPSAPVMLTYRLSTDAERGIE